MVSILDAAKYITEKRGEMSAMKLQKLMYYCQAWNLVWEENPLFADDFEAWANGPVLPELYAMHRGQFKVSPVMFSEADSSKLSDGERVNVDKVLGFYAEQTAQWLSNLTHQETPWLSARGTTPPGDFCAAIISQSAMHEYYSSL